MKFTGEISVKARRDAVFAALSDVHVFASLLDGVSALTPVDALGNKRFEAVLETKVAYMNFRFKVTVELTRITPPYEIAAKIEGAPLGLAGRLTAATVTRFIESGEASDETLIQYEMDTSLTGKLGSIGQSVMKAKAREMEKQFAKNLQARFDATVAA